MLRRLLKALLIGLLVLVGILLISNLDKGVERYASDKLQVLPRGDRELAEIVAPMPGVKILNPDQNIISVPPEKFAEYGAELKRKGFVASVMLVEQDPKFSITQYGAFLRQKLVQYTKGDFGTITYKRNPYRDYPITLTLPKMIMRSLGYMSTGLLIGLAAGFAFALTAVLAPRIGRIFDLFHGFLLSLPDFFIVVMLQFFGILLAKMAGHNVIAIMQYVNKVPFVIPTAAIAILPGALMYGILRIALQRELDEGYIKTARSKGLTHSMVVLRHMLRNTTVDLLAAMPRIFSVAITSMVVAEVICGIFGIGGYAINRDLLRTTSLPTTCAILAAFAMTGQLIIALLRKLLIVKTKEGA